MNSSNITIGMRSFNLFKIKSSLGYIRFTTIILLFTTNYTFFRRKISCDKNRKKIFITNPKSKY
jgi:hypothetical protein